MSRSLNVMKFDLGRLRTYDADPERVELIRARCLAALTVRGREGRAGRLISITRMTWLEPAIALGLCALYLTKAFSSSLALYR